MHSRGFSRPLTRPFCCALALLFAAALAADGQGNVFKHIRYNGGTFYTKVKPKDWHNQLTVSSDEITFRLADKQEIQILSKLVTALTYGQEASRPYFIGIQYASPKGEKAGLLLQADKNNYGAILQALQSVTGLPIEMSEKNRDAMPLGLRTELNVSGDAATAAQGGAQRAGDANAAQYGSLVITSDPPEADVYVDGAYVGITPASLDLTDGKHTVRVSSRGYTDWSREISVILRSRVTLAATMEKQK